MAGRLKQFTVDLETLAELLNLPKGTVINAVYNDGDLLVNRIRVIISHPEFPVVGNAEEVDLLITEAECGHNIAHFIKADA